MKALTVGKTRVFASALLALTLFGVVYPYRVNAAAVHRRANMIATPARTRIAGS